MKIKDITYEDVTALYNSLFSHKDENKDANPVLSNEGITNRDFGIKDYTVSSNTTIECIATIIGANKSI